jgi:hypothetical protein
MAPLLVERGYELFVVARRGDRLSELCSQLRERHGARVEAVALDLAAPGALETLRAETGDVVDLLVNNAGVGCSGPALEVPLERLRQVLELNVRALTELTLSYLPGMVARGRGEVLNVGSVVGFLPVPYMAVYAASKAYVLHFGEALDEELRGRGVRVRTLCPGATTTEFHEVASGGAAPTSSAAQSAVFMSAAAVAEAGVGMLGGSARVRTTGWLNKSIASLPRLLPRGVMTRLSRSFTPARP